jgi:hypothetical protein
VPPASEALTPSLESEPNWELALRDLGRRREGMVYHRRTSERPEESMQHFRETRRVDPEKQTGTSLPRRRAEQGGAVRLALGRSTVIAVALFVFACAHPGAAQEPAGQPVSLAAAPLDWPSLTGNGLISLPDASTLGRGRVSLGFAFDNQDRDPLKMDVLDLDVTWTIGLTDHLETYGHAAIARAVSVSPRQDLFPSPIDLIVPEGRPAPRRPYYPIYSAFPYVSRTGTSQLGRFTPGEAEIGLKRTLWGARRGRPALALSGELKLPLTRALTDLQSGSGTGAIDERLRVTGEWHLWHSSLVASLAYTRVGNGACGDQVIVYQSSGAVSVSEQPLRLPGNFVFGAGFRRVVTPQAALVAEVTKLTEVGGRTSAFRVPGPLDISLGTQLRWRNLRGTACIRHHANSIAKRLFDWPLAGLVDLGEVSGQDRVGYLQAIGAGAVLPHLRTGTQAALAAPSDAPPLPAGARILPGEVSMEPHGNFEYVFSLSWAFRWKP